MAANLTLIALNNENRISFGFNFELYMIVMKVRLRMKMMLIALVPDSICFNKVAVAVVGPRGQKPHCCNFAKKNYGDEEQGWVSMMLIMVILVEIGTEVEITLIKVDLNLGPSE